MVPEKPLPDGWKWVTLSTVADINVRNAGLKELPDDLVVSFVPMAAVDGDSGTILQPQERQLKEVRRGYTSFIEGDVIFAKITPCMENGKAAIAQNLSNGIGFGSTEFHVLRPKREITSKWLFYYVRQESFRADAKARFTGTAGQLRVPVGFFVDYPIPLPPLPEQERIVTKIEELFTQLEAGTESLQRIQAKLKRYQQVVFSAAVSGKLTEQWRSSQGSNPEGPGLPVGWVWTTVEEVGKRDEQVVLTGPFGASLGKKDFISSGVPVLTIGCLTGNGLSLDKAMFISNDKATELERYRVREGDLLFSRMASVGRAELVPSNFSGAVINYHLMRLRLDESLIDPQFFLAYVRGSKHVRHYIRGVNHGATRDGINTSQLMKMPIALPPIDEQQKILQEIETRISIIRQIEQSVDQTLQKAARLRQAILKRAFEGQL